ncbi:MAG TPA: hydrogenase maturation nickel metallochaperone HypA [Gemmatimonadales bacterium]|jgi:hydrogenase nickel incorporation protein HypA/HybF
MHELSIALSLVDAAREEADRLGARVFAVHLRVGALAGVVPEALLASYEMAAAGTPLEGSRLDIEEIPVVVFCPRCEVQRQLTSVQLFCCPECGTPTPQIERGRELELIALEIEQ